MHNITDEMLTEEYLSSDPALLTALLDKSFGRKNTMELRPLQERIERGANGRNGVNRSKMINDELIIVLFEEGLSNKAIGKIVGLDEKNVATRLQTYEDMGLLSIPYKNYKDRKLMLKENEQRKIFQKRLYARLYDNYKYELSETHQIHLPKPDIDY